MQFIFAPMNEADTREIVRWQYEEPYSVYNWEEGDDLAEMLDRRSPHYAVRDEQGDLIGFFAYGSVAYVWGSDVPHLYSEGNSVSMFYPLMNAPFGSMSGLVLNVQECMYSINRAVIANSWRCDLRYNGET